MDELEGVARDVVNGGDGGGGRPEAVVGIGASAGGLEAIESFFKAMPEDSGMAFVVVQHLAPDYKSLMVELLSRKTSIPVHRAEDGVTVEPNHIYLIPPRKNLTIFHGKLLLEDQGQREGINLPVDLFLRSLAEDQGERAVAVVLSGTGSDGTRGVRAVKEWGGLVVVQDEASAKFDGMPRAALSTGVADFVLPPEEMPLQLVACLRHPYASRQERQQVASDETGLTRLFSLLRAKTKVDFTYYKPSTILRRIDRRIAVTQVSDLDAYVRYAEQTPAEVVSLYRELLIGVTSFFRDPEVMERLREQVLPELMERSPNRELRFWVAGCSTGEEAYTLAILAREVMEGLGLARDVKIFATDIDRDAVAKAGAGVYPESIAADLNPQLLAKYFYCRGETYQVSRSIREMVVFAQHNLVKDPPFTRIDLVSCRNLLIYLQSNLQQRALEMFGFSLRPEGILVLGTSETVGEMEDCFEPLDRKLRIYRALGKASMRALRDNAGRPAREERPLPLVAAGQAPPSRFGARAQDRLVTRLLDSLAGAYVPLGVVVNEQLEVLHILGDPKGIFSLPSGRAVYDISKMVNRELAVPLATGVQKVLRTGEELTYSNVRLREGETARSMRLRMMPLPGRRSDEALASVFFEDIEETAAPSEPGAEYNLDEETGQRLQDLEQELQFTRENLQATIEELETSNEELQATNEELLASNEELQSTNEELQSTNEELYTVNTEYQNKIIELTEAHNDVDNLLSSSRIGTLILDEDMCIRRFSPQAAKVFALVESDIGRPLSHLSHNLSDFNPVESAREAQATGQALEVEARSEAGPWYLVRILPYRVGPQSVSGVVFTLVDVTPLRDARNQLEDMRQAEADIVRHMPAGLFVYDVHGDEMVLAAGNPSASRITGVNVQAAVGRRFEEVWTGPRSGQLKEGFLRTYYEGKPAYDPEVWYEDERVKGCFRIHAFRLPGNRLATAFEDVTERKRAEDALIESERFALGTLNALTAHLCVLDETGTVVAVNDAWRRFAEANDAREDRVYEGTNYLEVCGVTQGQDTSEAARFAAGIRTVLSGERMEFEMEYACHSQEEQRWFIGRVTRFPGGGPVRAVVAHENITERKLAERRLKASEQQFRGLYGLLADAEVTARMGSWTWEVATDTVTWSDNLYRIFGRDPALGAPSFQGHDGLYAPASMARLREAVERALRDGTGYTLELEAVRGDGTVVRCVARGQAELDDEGRAIRLYGSLQEAGA